jgi:hypothetical protein
MKKFKRKRRLINKKTNDFQLKFKKRKIQQKETWNRTKREKKIKRKSTVEKKGSFEVTTNFRTSLLRRSFLKVMLSETMKKSNNKD